MAGSFKKRCLTSYIRGDSSVMIKVDLVVVKLDIIDDLHPCKPCSSKGCLS